MTENELREKVLFYTQLGHLYIDKYMEGEYTDKELEEALVNQTDMIFNIMDNNKCISGEIEDAFRKAENRVILMQKFYRKVNDKICQVFQEQQ